MTFLRRRNENENVWPNDSEGLLKLVDYDDMIYHFIECIDFIVVLELLVKKICDNLLVDRMKHHDFVIHDIKLHINRLLRRRE